MDKSAVTIIWVAVLFVLVFFLLFRSNLRYFQAIKKDMDGFARRESERVTATPELRWAATRYDKARGLQGELQQLWASADGSVWEWRAVPRVELKG